MITSTMQVSRSEIVATRGVVAGGHQAEVDAGVRMLAEGGNAIDALVAAAFTACVVEPASCGLGGYGRMSIFLGDRREFVTIDHYVRAPLKATPAMFAIAPTDRQLYYGWPQVVDRRNEWGYLSPAVPGAVSGLCAAQAMFGRLPLSEVLAPAIEAAEAGVIVEWWLLNSIVGRLKEIRSLPAAAALLLRDGDPPRAQSGFASGERLDLSPLAETLRRIAINGAAGFYTGEIAEAIANEVSAHGGILSREDLATYRPKIMRERPLTYRDHQYITANDQVGYEALNILECFDVQSLGPESLEFRHLMAESLALAFRDNMVHYADAEHAPSPVRGLANPAFAATRAELIRFTLAQPRPVQAADPWPFDDAEFDPEHMQTAPSVGGAHGTTQVCAADSDGNLVTLCTSLSGSFGSLVLVPETGVFLNNSMQNFDPRPDRANCIQPGKMPIFAAPVIAAARDGRAAFGSAGSGGYRIAAGVLHSMVNAIDFGMGIQESIDSPRVHCQGHETVIDSRIPAEVREGLSRIGHQVVVAEETPGALNFGRVCSVGIDHETGLLHAGAGPAWISATAGI